MEGQISTIRGTVRAVDGQEAVVEVEQGGCGRCHEEGGCGGQHLTQMLCAGKKTYRVDNPCGAVVGDSVTIAIAAGAVRRSANLAYGLPLVAVIVGAVAGMQLGGDPGAMVGGSLGLFAAWLTMRRVSAPGAGNSDVRPYIISRSHS
ncbi:MAG TPA: SoxR reducing system RseC family protein [Rhodocyclaceae bacterium]|nr:SoxR reducing system RseC family protein [Rhodocyclaceae bacterium]